MTSPDAVDRRDLLDRRGGDPVDRSERVGQRARRRRADVADAEAVQQPIDRAILRGGDRRQQVRDRAVLEVRQLADLLVGQGEDVGLIGDQPAFEQLLRGPLAQVLDVHRAAARRSGRCAPRSGPGTAGSGSARPPRPRGGRSASRSWGSPRASRTCARRPCAGWGSARRPPGSPRPRGARPRCRRSARPCARPRRRCAASPSRSVTPPTRTGSSTANGVTAPVRPTLTWMSRRMVVCSSAGNL